MYLDRLSPAELDRIKAGNQATIDWLSNMFPIGFRGINLVTGHRLDTGSSWAGYPCPLCGGVHLHDTYDSLAIASRPCLDDEVLLFIREDERTMDEMRELALEWYGSQPLHRVRAA